MVIPAHPLALNVHRQLDERRQQGLTRYYLDAGAGGIAVGVHTTQFEIRDPRFGLLDPVLTLASETIDAWAKARRKRVLKIAGVCGAHAQAIREAELAATRGYDAGLLSLSALTHASEDDLIRHCRDLAAILPIFGFYLQPAVGGRVLPYTFWRRFVEIDQVLAIKIAPFNRYQTLEVVRAVWEVRHDRTIALYTGNDDQIVLDLLTPFRFSPDPAVPPLRIVGGLLGHWAVWTQQAVALLDRVHALTNSGHPIPPEWLTTAQQITDANAAIFDAANGFRGCIAGIHEVLRRQGLLEGTWCLSPAEQLSSGQSEAIDRILALYPHLTDDSFVAANRHAWLEEDSGALEESG
jgi:dihydrodipicolinate synthase/N-acetylneuraminate lyase